MEPESPYRPSPPNRGPWIIAGAVLLAAALVVGYLVWSSGAECRNWQKEIAEAFEDLDHLDFTQTDFQTLTPEEQQKALAAAELGEDRPAGCDFPDEAE